MSDLQSIVLNSPQQKKKDVNAKSYINNELNKLNLLGKPYSEE